jgi:L-lactate dehydrogenase complex protein LldG
MTTMVVEIPTDIEAMLGRVRACVEPLGVTVLRVATSVEAADAIAAQLPLSGADAAVISTEVAAAGPSLMAALDRAGVAWRHPASVDDARDQPLGMSLAVLAIAETGSVMLAERTLEDRAACALTRNHITIVRSSTLVPSLVEAAPALREVAKRPGGGYGTLMTGPSRTADIEMSLTVGVQGPSRVVTLFVDDLS